MTTYTFTQLHACAAREVRQRKHVYPRLIEGGKMTQKFADDQTAQMQAIADHFEELSKTERLL